MSIGGNRSPALSTGIISISPGRTASDITIGFPLFQSIPCSKSDHKTKLSLVYGAGPYLFVHHVGISVKPNISQGVVLGVVVS